MRSSLPEEEHGVEQLQSAARLLILEDTPRGQSRSGIAATLETQGYPAVAVSSAAEALPVLRRTPPDLLVMAVGPDGSTGSTGRQADLRAAARELRIPVLDVVEMGTGLRRRIEATEQAGDWMVRGGSAEELAARVAGLLRRRAATSATTPRPASSPIDNAFSSLVVHDLRTPLNVIGLSLRMIEQALPRDDPEVVEDLRFIDENLRQIERMLTQLSDYSRLLEPNVALTVSEFEPRRLVSDLLENRDARSRGKGSPVILEVENSCPAEASLDQGRARLAIEYALINAGAAVQDEPIRLTLRGSPQRWIIEVAIDRPPPTSVRSIELHSRAFERLCGSAAERRGMDLAIAARVSELFNGSARLDAQAERSTTITLDWPARIADGSPIH